MKKYIFFALFSVLFLATACKSEFEKIRTSGNAELLYSKAEEYYAEEEYQKAQTLYELIVANYRGKQEAEEIYWKYAQTYYKLGRYILASYYFNNFANTFPNSKYRQEADFMSAYSNYQLSPTFRLDQTNTLKAIDQLQLFINTYPTSERVAQANTLIDEMREKLEEKAFKEGELYFELRQYQAAMHSLENTLKDFPETDRAEEMRYLIIRAAFLLAENSVVDKQQDRYKVALEKSNRFLQRYDQSEYFNDVTLINKRSAKQIKESSNVRYQEPSARTRS